MWSLQLGTNSACSWVRQGRKGLFFLWHQHKTGGCSLGFHGLLCQSGSAGQGLWGNHCTTQHAAGGAWCRQLLCFLLPQQVFLLQQGGDLEPHNSLWQGWLSMYHRHFFTSPNGLYPPYMSTTTSPLFLITKVSTATAKWSLMGERRGVRVAPDGGETTHYLHTEASLEET